MLSPLIGYIRPKVGGVCKQRVESTVCFSYRHRHTGIFSEAATASTMLLPMSMSSRINELPVTQVLHLITDRVYRGLEPTGRQAELQKSHRARQGRPPDGQGANLETGFYEVLRRVSAGRQSAATKHAHAARHLLADPRVDDDISQGRAKPAGSSIARDWFINSVQ
jgi:hypothetical protein